MKTGLITMALVLLVALACAAAAESPKVTLDASDTPIAQAMADLGKQANVQIVCDSDLKQTITGHFQSMELEKLLDTITKVNDLTWQKLYLPAQQPGQKLTPEQIKARAEAVAAVTGGPIVVCDPVTGKQKVFVEQDPAKQSVAPDKLGLELIYLIAKPKAAVKDSAQQGDAAKRFKTLETERMKLLSEMTSAERQSAMQQETVDLMKLDPATRQQVMIDQILAQHNMDPQTQAAYWQVRHDTMRTMHDQGLIPNDQGGPGGGRGRRGGGGGGGDAGGGQQQP